MRGHTRWVSRERPDLARSALERCWIDGDLIRLSTGGEHPDDLMEDLDRALSNA